MSDYTSASNQDRNAFRVAVIGMAGRFPGASDIESFWDNLVHGRESVKEWTDEELSALGVPPEQLIDPDFVRASAPLEGADQFDAEFFGYSPSEAEILDPQQRLFLECAWAALERAGYQGDTFDGSIGVYASSGFNTYLLNLHANAAVRQSISPFELFVANDKDFLATRTAYKLNLRGPAMTVQTACSSSLVSIHVAAQSLIAGECDIALAGGVTVSRSHGYVAREGGILSPDGHCRAFDADAAGTVPGSGVGVVVLKRLEDALADGDTIDAVIIGSAINNDGALKASFTAPQVDSQAMVISEAHAAAGISADSIGYIEAHGTGTSLGDPIEIAALTQAFRKTTTRTGYCAIGSVKTNIGHLDTAAGIAGFIKTVLCLKHGRIPASLHFKQANAKIDFPASPFAVNTALRDWDAVESPRRAGISSLGIGGTNAHLVLEEAPTDAGARTKTQPASPQLLVFSARNDAALSALLSAQAKAFEANPELAINDVAFTLRHGRKAFSHRQSLVADDLASAATELHRLAAQKPSIAGSTPSPVFLFPGQGSQYAGMGKDLYERVELFRAPFDACADRLSKIMQRDFRADLFAGHEDIHNTEFAQPALFAVEYTLAKAWMAQGVIPQALHGHSIGEYVAACLAGVFDLDTALSLVVARGRLMQQAAPGAMLAVVHPDAPIDRWLNADIALAASNAPGLSVVSGSTDAIARLETELKQARYVTRRLKTGHAFHSPMMAQAAARYLEELRNVRLSPPSIAMISNVTGTWLSASQATDPNYWARHLEQTVRFDEGMRTLLGIDNTVFIEAGPGSALSGLISEQAIAEDRIIPCLGRASPENETGQYLAALGRYWRTGGHLDWQAVSAEGSRVPLATYPFQGQRYWISAQTAENQAPVSTAVDSARIYRPTWQRLPPATPADCRNRRVLILDEGRIGKSLAARLEGAGAQAYRAIEGDRFDECDFRCFSLAGHSAADFSRLLETLGERGALPQDILYLWPLKPGQRDEVTTLLNLVRALTAQGHKSNLTLVTNGATDVTGLENLDELQSQLPGILKVAGQEYEDLTCRHIDIMVAQDMADQAVADRLLAEFNGSGPVVAIRGPHRWSHGFAPLDLPEPQASARLKKNGIYVVIGNIAEGVGTVWLDHLAKISGTRLSVLHSIKDAETAIRLDAAIDTRRIDCNDPAAIGAALDEVVSRHGRIDGIFLSMPQANRQAAAPLSMMDDTHLTYNETVRIAPLRALIKAMEQRRAGFCCIQSSLATVIGGVGLAAYTSGYQAVELLVAAQSRSARMPWFAIGYPLIDVLAAGKRSSLDTNAYAVASDDAWDLTRRIIENGITGTTMLSRSDITVAPTAVKKAQLSKAPVSGRARPAMSTPFIAPRTHTETTVAGIFEELIGVSGIGVDDGFYELGGHSLLAIRVVAKLRETFPVKIEMRELLFENPTVARVASMITAHMPDEGDLDEMAALLMEIESLSDSEVQSALGGAEAR
ncbi:beta-ketoacyl synthase N-terminal-like domain-containing protein [Rhizobium rhizogenes]|uniref:type I polyketide synthase n=1 Tax=Rhizobium rhizogenes TaxID=359 RepID=UPI0022C7E529|nr:beta-ketoacyl synthase N-terminal-like domain-containing protein [Rhizobium rhizogenes]MCZ7486927.1 beta-ketoacyl synthase N-terminal-like domain-containing protein [Rhizobium rhizogenes]